MPSGITGEESHLKEESGQLRPLTKAEFEKIATLARDRFGLDLRTGKEELVSARLGKQLRASKFRTFGEYYEHLVADQTGEEIRQLINALTTNHTSFFREPAHFDYLTRVILPAVPPPSNLRVWSAACSTGEEAYSILMTVGEATSGNRVDRVELFATDISSKVLAVAQRAVYAEDRLRDVAAPVLSRYLLRGQGKSAGYYRVKPQLVSRVEYQWMNLIESFPKLQPFHVIFCRNVMIYFNRETQERLVNQLAACLVPGGHLLVGHAESLTGVRHGLDYVKPSIYRRRA